MMELYKDGKKLLVGVETIKLTPVELEKCIDDGCYLVKVKG